MKILVITYTYLPDETPRSSRWDQLIQKWKKMGHEVYIATASGAPSDHDDKNARVLRINENFIGRIRRRFTKNAIKNSTVKDSSELFINKFYKDLLKFIFIRLYKSSLKFFQWPDYAWTWISTSKKQILNLIRCEGPFDIIISVSHPFSSHVVANSIKKEFADLRWIIDMGDPFCFLEEAQPNNFKLYSNLNHRIERNIFKSCDAVSVTTEETKQEYVKLFPESAEKIEVIPPLVDERHFNQKLAIKHSNDVDKKDDICLVFSGTLYSKIRNPIRFLEMLERVANISNKNIEMHFFGLTNDFNIDSLPKYSFDLEFHGEVSKERVMSEIQSSDILVNIGNATSYQLPSKLVDYSLTGKPILNISSIDNDSSTAFLETYSNFLNICLNKDLDEEVFKKICNFIEAKTKKSDEEIMKFLSPYRLEAVAESYEKLFI